MELPDVTFLSSWGKFTALGRGQRGRTGPAGGHLEQVKTRLTGLLVAECPPTPTYKAVLRAGQPSLPLPPAHRQVTVSWPPPRDPLPAGPQRVSSLSLGRKFFLAQHGPSTPRRPLLACEHLINIASNTEVDHLLP